MAIQGGLYARGEYYLDYVKGKGGKPASSKLYICWYDRNAGRIKRKSTGTPDVQLATQALDAFFLAQSEPGRAAEDTPYAVSQAMTDYWLSVGSNRTSADAIRSRLKLFSRFLDHEVEQARMSDPILPSDLNDRVVERFRAWGVADPILTKKRAPEGGWTHSERPRTASTVEESVIQLKAALNHAVPRFLPSAPVLKHLTRDQVTVPRDFRLSEEMLARMLDYTAAGGGKYAGHPARLLPLRRYLIAAISTLGRPDAIMDMSVLPARSQWRANQMMFDLNPSGRIQTRKRRAALPIPAMLDRWLRETDDKFVCREVIRRNSDGDEWIEQVPVASVKKAWQGMARDMDIPSGWGPKLIRHSVATIIAEKRVDMVELEIALGHRPIKRTTARYTTFRPDYLTSVRSCIAALWEELERLCEHPLHASLTQVGEDGRRRQL